MNTPLTQAKVIDFRVRVPPALCPEIEVPEASSSQYESVLNTGEKYAQAQTLEHLLTGMDNNGVNHA